MSCQQYAPTREHARVVVEKAVALTADIAIAVGYQKRVAVLERKKGSLARRYFLRRRWFNVSRCNGCLGHTGFRSHSSAALRVPPLQYGVHTRRDIFAPLRSPKSGV